MELIPIISAMRRNFVGVGLIVLQMSVTLAVLCNSIFIVQQRLSLSGRPTGTAEKEVFAITMQWVGVPANPSASLLTDLALLRSLPNVQDAYATNSYPMSQNGSNDGVDPRPERQQPMSGAAVYFGDEHAIGTLGLQLIAGRNFNPSEILDHTDADHVAPATVIITRDLSQKLFPNEDPLGKVIWLTLQKGSSQIVGVVDRLEVPWVGTNSFMSAYDGYSMLEPFRYTAPYVTYMVRTRPGELNSVMKAAQEQLLVANKARVFRTVESLETARARAYRDDRGLAKVLITICLALLSITSLGIVGLTSYWVAQRRHQIGIRRALGANKLNIVGYFQTENIIITGSAALLGALLALAINQWMVRSFEMMTLDFDYVVMSALIIMALGQFSVVVPAIRASTIPPSIAIRET